MKAAPLVKKKIRILLEDPVEDQDYESDNRSDLEAAEKPKKKFGHRIKNFQEK